MFRWPTKHLFRPKLPIHMVSLEGVAVSSAKSQVLVPVRTIQIPNAGVMITNDCNSCHYTTWSPVTYTELSMTNS